MWLRRLATLLVTLALGCAGTPGVRADAGVPPEELLQGSPWQAAGEPPGLVDPQAVLAVSPAMQAFLDAHVDRDGGRNLRLHQLVHALIDEGSFGLEYDDVTRTASETFRLRRGNCLSFSTMFVAMARAVGLRASFQEVDIPPDWTFEADAYVLNTHVNILVDFGANPERVVDFNIGDFRASYDMRRISDSRALAHHYNNWAVESLHRGDLTAAFWNLRRAIVDCDRRYSPAWTSLGTLYLREGLPLHAEAAYLQALEVDRQDLVAMSNLVELYVGLGQPERAGHFRNRVNSHRKQNPYFRFHLGHRALLAEEYESAIEHLKYAVRKQPDEARFAFLLGFAYLQSGDERAARRWMTRARDRAASDAVKERYSSKMDRLLSASASLSR